MPSGGNAAKSGRRKLVKGGWIVAFDGTEHRILKDGVILIEGGDIRHVGRSYDGPVDETIDASRDLVIPGLINTHVHLGSQAGDRMVLDAGRRDLFRSGFLNHWPSKGIRGPNLFAFEDLEASLRYSFASLVKFGSTTIVEMGGEFGDDPAGLARMAAALGVRLYTTPGFASASHYYDQGGRHHRHWDEAAGEAALDKAIEFAERHDDSEDGLVRAILVPYEFWTCTPELMKRAKRAADRLKILMTFHVAESVIEFHDTVLQRGRTPIGTLADWGLLDRNVVLGHCLYTGGHSQTAFPFRDDLALIADSGASVAHCPAVFSRRGVALESFERYRDAGINLGLGTDSYPQDMLDELKYAAVVCKVADRNHEAGKARDVFNAATLGGAKALGRDDLGRLAPGARADLVIVDFDRLRIGPFLDPIKALVHCGNGELVKQVLVNGRTVVKDGRIEGWDEQALVEKIRQSTDRAWSRFAEFHMTAEPIDAAYPNAFRPWAE
ncbi:MAG: chlorohydrolase family protein [Dongiaceae bacterium]